jgi:hypothetical protein
MSHQCGGDLPRALKRPDAVRSPAGGLAVAIAFGAVRLVNSVLLTVFR